MPESFIVLHGPPPSDLNAQWRNFLKQAEFAAHYTTPDYFQEPFVRGKRPFAVLAFEANEVVAVLTGHHDGRSLRSGLSVRPQLTFSRTYPKEKSFAALLAGLREEAKFSDTVDLHSWTKLPVKQDLRTMVWENEGVVLMDLTETPETLFRGFSGNKKTNIKKAIKLGVQVEVTRSEGDILSFYCIMRDWALRKQISIPEKSLFVESFLFCSNRHLFVARYEGEIIAGVVVLGYPGGVLEYAANSSLSNYLHLRPNDLLHWHVIKWAHQHHFRTYNLAASHLFLRKFGGPLVPTYQYRIDCTMLRLYFLRDVSKYLVMAAASRLPNPIIQSLRHARSAVRSVGGSSKSP